MDTWCRIDETLGWIIEILFSFPSDMYDILKQVKRYSVQSSEGGNKETGEKKVNKSKNKDFLCGIDQSEITLLELQLFVNDMSDFFAE